MLQWLTSDVAAWGLRFLLEVRFLSFFLDFDAAGIDHLKCRDCIVFTLQYSDKLVLQ